MDKKVHFLLKIDQNSSFSVNYRLKLTFFENSKKRRSLQSSHPSPSVSDDYRFENRTATEEY